MAYDRDEWRTPWRLDPHATGGQGPVTGARAATDHPGPGTGRASGAEANGADELARGPVVIASTPIARHPQPPPSSWDPVASGPGSPAGSVRPPDTTGTHDAPPVRSRRGRTFLVAAIGGLVGALVGGGVVAALVTTGDGVPLVGDAPAAGESPSLEIDGDADVTSLVPALAEAVLPSVVSIDVPGVGPAIGGGGGALGSGVIYRSDGFILTNDHVIGDAEEVTVRLASGDILSATVVGSDQLNDLAVIQVAEDDLSGPLPAIDLRETDDLTVGEPVIAIGSPFGLDGSVTSGIVSGLNRDLTVAEEDGAGLTIPAVIQTDAAINPGNSGGALVDAQGRLIGINTAILTRTGGSQGVGFAVPAGQAVISADQIIEQGFVRHPLLGISGLDVSPEAAEEFGLDAPRGAIVDGVQEGTGAEAAGVTAGDIIVAVDGEPLATMSQLVAEVRSRAPGDTVTLTIVRDAGEVEVEVTLSERPRD